MSEHQSIRSRSHQGRFLATVSLLIVLVCAFFIQLTVLRSEGESGFLNQVLALSAEGLAGGYVWQLLTFQFLHADLAHILTNSLIIFFIGRYAESLLGARTFLKLFLAGGAFGGMLQVIGDLLSPGQSGGFIIGASGGAFASAAAVALIVPELRITVFNFRAKYLIVPALLLPILGLLTGGTRAHLAHFGSLIAGAVFVFLRRTNEQHCPSERRNESKYT